MPSFMLSSVGSRQVHQALRGHHRESEKKEVCWYIYNCVAHPIGMVSCMDEGIGNVTQALKEKHVLLLPSHSLGESMTTR